MKLIANRGGVWQCVQCGQPSPDQAKPHLGSCLCSSGHPGLGDMVAAGLKSVGVTKQRAQAIAKAAGMADCGCEQRQRKWNEWGYKLGIGTPPQPRETPP